MGTDAQQGDRLQELTGLPGSEDVQAALQRMAEHFDDLREQLGLPSPQAVTQQARNADRWWEEFGDKTGIPTYHDALDTAAELLEKVRKHVDPEDDDREKTKRTSGIRGGGWRRPGI